MSFAITLPLKCGVKLHPPQKGSYKIPLGLPRAVFTMGGYVFCKSCLTSHVYHTYKIVSLLILLQRQM